VGEDGYLAHAHDAHGRERHGVDEGHGLGGVKPAQEEYGVRDLQRQEGSHEDEECYHRLGPACVGVEVLLEYVRPVHEYEHEYAEEAERSHPLEDDFREFHPPSRFVRIEGHDRVGRVVRRPDRAGDDEPNAAQCGRQQDEAVECGDDRRFGAAVGPARCHSFFGVRGWTRGGGDGEK